MANQANGQWPPDGSMQPTGEWPSTMPAPRDGLRARISMRVADWREERRRRSWERHHRRDFANSRSWAEDGRGELVSRFGWVAIVVLAGAVIAAAAAINHNQNGAAGS